jgi:hypothetical protein
MTERKFGMQTYLSVPRPLSSYYENEFKVFEFILGVSSVSEINRFSKLFVSLSSGVPKDDKIEFYLRVPNLSFTGVGSCDQISEVIDLCKAFSIKKLVLNLGKALSNENSDIRKAKASVIAFMNRVGPQCEACGVHIYWENTTSGFGNVEDIIEILSKKRIKYRQFFETRFNLENFVASKYSLEEACKFATDIAFSDYDGNHEEILKLTKGKTIMLSRTNGFNFKNKLVWEESYPRKLNVDKKAKRKLARNRLNKVP